MLNMNPISDDDYQILYDSFTGGGGFADGSYLYQHRREDDIDFVTRKRMSRYSNFVKVIVNALTNPIFKKTIVRDFATNQMLERFCENVDGKGTSINKFMKKATKWARVYGRVFIVEDNFTADQMAVNELDALEKRQFPYLYLVRPDQIIDYECDKNGLFLMFKYKLRSRTTKNDLKSNISYNEWTWKLNSWECKDEDGNSTLGENKLCRVPVVSLSATDEKDDIVLPVPTMLHIAKANRDIFNRDSEKREILRNQCFPVLVYPITTNMANQIKQVDENGNEIGLNIGTNNMLIVDATHSSMPTFIAPPIQPIQIIQQEIKDTVDDMFRQAGLTSVVAVETKQSGVAKQWDFEETNHNLADMAENCESAEIGLFELFQKWTGKEIIDLKIKYPREFNITDVIDELEKAQKMKDLVVGGPVVNREIDRKISEIYFADADDNRYNEIVSEIESMPNDLSFSGSEE